MTEPLVPNQDHANAAHAQKMQALAAEARRPGEWLDIYSEIVEYNVKTTMEAHGDGQVALEALRERRGHIKHIRTALEEHGLPLSEDVEIEGGPHVEQDQFGLPTKVIWPGGEWIRLCWKDGSKVEFRGAKAWTAYTFIRWWASYHQMFLQLTDPGSAKPKSRIIEPHSPEWVKYMEAKRKDQARGVEP